MPISSIKLRLTDRIPQALDDGVLYVSNRFSTSAHNCCCGCGGKVVLPLKPGKWSMTNRRNRVSLTPSVGNWSLACQSHYWIRDGSVRWADPFNATQVRANRVRDRAASGVAHELRRISERRFWQRLYDKVRTFLRRG